MGDADPGGGPDVSRETPAMPAAAAHFFPPERLQLAARYTEMLATAGVERGLIGPREAPRLWERHLLNCAALAEALPADSTVADIGAGAGLPGLVLAIARPDLRITLVEPLLRRTTFLQEAVDQLALEGVTIHRGRADSLHGRAVFDVVTSRAVAGLDRLLTWSMPLVTPTGSLVAMKGSSAGDEIVEARPVLLRLGCSVPALVELGSAHLDPPTVAVVVSWADPERVGWPTAREHGGGRGGRAVPRSRADRRRSVDRGR